MAHLGRACGGGIKTRAHYLDVANKSAGKRRRLSRSRRFVIAIAIDDDDGDEETRAGGTPIGRSQLIGAGRSSGSPASLEPLEPLEANNKADSRSVGATQAEPAH